MRTVSFGMLSLLSLLPSRVDSLHKHHPSSCWYWCSLPFSFSGCRNAKNSLQPVFFFSCLHYLAHPALCVFFVRVPPHDQVAPEYLATHVDRLLKALLVCFFDESWPVRDAACVASGRFAGAYPEECRPSLEKLYERFVW